jgi:hypothetical protein
LQWFPLRSGSSRNRTDFDVHLIKEDGSQTPGLLTQADLTRGRWTANLDAASSPPATDIVTHVAGVTPDRRSHTDYEEIAQTLYDWLLPAGDLRKRWLALDNSRLYVETSVDALARLPWEMACPKVPPLRRPALIGGLCRLNPRTDDNVSPPVAIRRSTWPFRILIVIGCKADEEEGLDISTEVKAIERIFHPLGRTVDIHCMYRPVKSDMMQWIKRFHPHIHFAGHGEKIAGADQYGLRIESDDGGWNWTSDAIDVDLPKARWVPKFVFLNACRSSTESKRELEHAEKLCCGRRKSRFGHASGRARRSLREVRGNALRGPCKRRLPGRRVESGAYDHS